MKAFLDIENKSIQFSDEEWNLIPIKESAEEIDKMTYKAVQEFIKLYIHKILNKQLPRELDL